jgi:ADP-ribose pyrophosphatase
METRDRRTIFNGLVIDIEQMEVEVGSRGWHTFQVIRHPGGAGVLPVHDDGSISLIRQLRPAVGKHVVEIPAGRLSPGEEPCVCAERELAEETGLRAARFIPLGLIQSSPGVFDEIIHLYAGCGLTQGAAAPEEDEEMELLRIDFREAWAMVSDGRISDAKTVAAIARWGMMNPASGAPSGEPGA